MTRVQTPPGLKWALNERAAVAARVEELAKRLRAVQGELESAKNDLAALDRAIAVLDTRVRADALGSIRARAGRYGQHGALNLFLLRTLQQAGCRGVTTTELSLAAQAAFGLEFATPHEREDFQRHSVRNRLQEWRARGDVEMVYERIPTGRVARWRWRQPPTLQNIAAEAKR